MKKGVEGKSSKGVTVITVDNMTKTQRLHMLQINPLFILYLGGSGGYFVNVTLFAHDLRQEYSYQLAHRRGSIAKQVPEAALA
jgi:hypothetical protein